MWYCTCNLQIVLGIGPRSAHGSTDWQRDLQRKLANSKQNEAAMEVCLPIPSPSIGLYMCVPFLQRRKWQPTPVFLPGESQGWGSLVGCHLCGHTESDMTEVTQQQQQQQFPSCGLLWMEYVLRKHVAVQVYPSIAISRHSPHLGKKFSFTSQADYQFSFFFLQYLCFQMTPKYPEGSFIFWLTFFSQCNPQVLLVRLEGKQPVIYQFSFRLQTKLTHNLGRARLLSAYRVERIRSYKNE